MASSVATPQNVRNPSDKDLVRWQRSQELWDDMANTIFVSTTAVSGATQLVVPMPVPGAIEVMASALLNGAGVLTLNVDGVGGPTATTTSATTAVIIHGAGFAAGLHSFYLTSGASMSQVRLVCRRGRQPNP